MSLWPDRADDPLKGRPVRAGGKHKVFSGCNTECHRVESPLLRAKGAKLCQSPLDLPGLEPGVYEIHASPHGYTSEVCGYLASLVGSECLSSYWIIGATVRRRAA